MEKLEKYRELITQILSEHIEREKRNGRRDDEYLLTFEGGRHYFWHNFDLKNGKRVLVEIVYVRLIDGKIWIENDQTANGIAGELKQAGVPEEDIVLAYRLPNHKRLSANVREE